MRRLLLLPLLAGMFGCSDQPLSTAPATRLPRFDIADAARAYKKGFYWLPPMVSQPTVTGTFDAALSPTVEICELLVDACGTVLATYTTTTGPGGEYVRLEADEQQYHVNWHTNEFELSTTKFYRVSARAGIYDVLLGYADVQPVSNGSGLKNVDTDEYIGLVDGRTLPIKFRIETDIVGRVEVQPVEATAEPGATQQFVAILRDLHGNLMSADVNWASSDEAVAIVDGNGLATAIEDGEATITATSEQISGSATLTVEGGVVIVSSGRGHACALNEDGRPFCWGRNEHGQLGDGTLIDRRTPTPVAGGHTFVAIASGDFHSCGITEAGQAYCWGLNQNEELGDGTRLRRTAPVAVLGGLSFVSISTGSSNTCAITADHRAYCWGQGSFGAVGNGSTTARISAPAAVSGGHTFTMISSGQQYTCGVTTSGEAYCWGLGSSGRLGNGSTANRLTPFPVSGGLSFTTIHAGDRHTCGITTSSQAYCWGEGQFGRLGNGSSATVSTPQPVSGGLLFAQISAGGLHTCGVTLTGQGYCWGGNVDGSLGTGSGLSRSTPGLVIGGHTWTHVIPSGEIGPTFGGGSTFAFTCGVTVDNQTYCWGSNFFGQLGDGTTRARGSPAPVVAFP